MADLQTIIDIVLDYAKHTNRFLTPATEDDPIQPAPSSLSQEVFFDFYFELLHALSQKQISARLPVEGMRACRLWRDVCMLVLHFQ